MNLSSISWNVEGLKRNLYNLKFFTDLYKPQMLFLSEPQLFQSDLPQVMKYFKGEYSAVLNSEDLHTPELALTSSRPKGGTMVMWGKELNSIVTIHIPDSASFTPVVVDIPGWLSMDHIAVYLRVPG